MPTTYYTFVYLTAFAKAAKGLLTDDELHRIEVQLCQNPDAGEVIGGAHGARKLRIPVGTHGKGRGARVLYYARTHKGVIYLMDVYTKGQKEILSPSDQKALATIIGRLETE